MEKKWLVTFAYSGCGKREFFTQEFTVVSPSENIEKEIKTYVDSQNRGETKSDHIRYYSKTMHSPQPLSHDKT